MRDDSPADESAGPEDEAHPAGGIRLSPARSVGLRVNALAGWAVGAIVAVAAALPPNTHTTSKG